MDIQVHLCGAEVMSFLILTLLLDVLDDSVL